MPRRRFRGEALRKPSSGSHSESSDAQPNSREILDEWFSATYRELHHIAASLKRADANATISTSTLVHEAWLKLANSEGWTPESELHFKRVAARAMRQIVMDEVRRRQAQKRGGGGAGLFVTLDDSMGVPVSRNEDLLRLDAALDALSLVNPRQAELVLLRFFGGCDVATACAALEIKESTASRDWRVAKAWLAAETRRGG